ncbi:unnamed protein product [Lactuca virosa]|uniref:AAA+ ATPase domain-containing protein n=1 Tax=Lactuca virosa TaxID=75947 RepID=A0AAU9PAP2_9ASTR|nr:unnamed protein product [Lactuca virosa]
MAEVMTNTLVGKIVDLLFSAAKRQIDYVRNYTENIEKLRNEAQKLKDMKGRIQQKVHAADDKGDRLLDGVQNWIDKAGTEISMVQDFLEQEVNVKKTWFNSRFCVNLGTLYRYSKMATDKTHFLVQHQEDGKPYESCVSIPTPSPSFVDLYQRKNLDDIDTQKLTLEKVITTISDESIQIVGIYGLGGVGKTTLAKEVAVKLKNQFADIVFITVSQTVDAKMVKEKVKDAAKKVMIGKKILIILDDIWEILVLPDMGIPCGNDHMNCKILLTSRSKNVCEAMTEENNIICVNPLTKEEAWVLFKRVVYERTLEASVELEKIARDVTKKCNGLPSIIHAVGTTLKNKSIDIWKAKLDRLQNHALVDLDQEIEKAFTRLKLSYDYLRSEEAKSCFLLCSLFKEDEIIPLKILAEYGVSLGIFNNLESINDAKNRVQIAVDTLASSLLLVPDRWRNRVRIHDVVRDLALLIGKDKFMVKVGKDLKRWQPRNNTSQNYTKISLMECRVLNDLILHFPSLDTLLLQRTWIATVPDEFFEGVRELKVLDMTYCTMSSLPQSLKLLTKLRMLNLSGNTYFHEISILGDLKNLEILKLRNTIIERIPEEIGQLTNLRLLDVYGCKCLSHVTPGVISKFVLLEKLHIGFFLNQEENYNCLVEISNLKSLKTLQLYVFHCDLIPEGANFKILTKFSIQIGKFINIWVGHRSHRLQIAESNIPFKMLIKELIQVSDTLVLWLIKDLDNIVPDLYKESFDELKCIKLRDCQNVSCLVKTRNHKAIQTFFTSNDIGQIRQTKKKFFSQVEEIYLVDLPCLKLLWDCPHQYISFSNLQTIEINGCSSLLMLFPMSIVQELAKLRDILILRCDSLADVITETQMGIPDPDANIVFPLLTNISLGYLPKLKSFYSGHSSIKYPSLKSIMVKDCRSMERWGYGVHDIPKINFHHQGTPCNINDIITLHHKTNKDMEFETPP